MNFIQAKQSTSKDFMTGVSTRARFHNDKSVGQISLANINPQHAGPRVAIHQVMEQREVFTNFIPYAQAVLDFAVMLQGD